MWLNDDIYLFFFNFSIIDRLDGVRLLWSLLKSNNPKVYILFSTVGLRLSNARYFQSFLMSR